MTLLERIAQITPYDALFCVDCHRHGCSTAPCPSRRAARARGLEGPAHETRHQMEMRCKGWDSHDDRSDIQPHTRTTAYK